MAGRIFLCYGGGERVLKTTGSAQTLYVRGTASYPLVVRSRTGGSEMGVMVHIYGAGGLIAQHAPAGALTAHYVVSDHLGSARVLFDGADGIPVASYAYAVMGQQTQVWQDRARYTFTGQEFDAESGVYNYRARLYDPELGRFYAVDPAGQFSSPYLYAGNSPVMMTDPDGEFAFVPLLVAIGYGAIIGGATSAAIYTAIALPSGNFSWSGLGSATLGGAVGGAVSGGIGGLGIKVGSYALHAGLDILTGTLGQVAATAATGGDITLGTIVGGVVGGLAGGALPKFRGVQGGWFRNAVAEVGHNSIRGALAGGAGGAFGALADGRNVGDGFISGAKGGAIMGAGSAFLKIAAFGSAYRLDSEEAIKEAETQKLLREEYGFKGPFETVYRRGGITNLLLGQRGNAIGGTLRIPRGSRRDYYLNTIAHENAHYWQQVDLGWSRSLVRVMYEGWRYARLGLDVYDTPGTLENQANMIGCSVHWAALCVRL